jgi:FtsP/CotA-like multicopper oxidase with cupredoxin domain
MVHVSANDNRRAAGTTRGAVRVVRLVARAGTWHPDGDAAPGAPVQAFAEEGRAPSIPGPMIRVRAGTEVLVTVRNALPGATLALSGLVPHDSSREVAGPLVVAPGATDTVRLRLDVPGTYYYWGTTTGRALDVRTGEDAQLTGAIIVDAPEGVPPPDRVMVLGMWSDTTGRAYTVRKRVLLVVNGRSWPHTERLRHDVGDRVRWRLINASADVHPMHLHGFYFSVDSRGDAARDTLYAEGARDRVVTELMRVGGTMSMSWTPERPGNWLFHCHLPDHFEGRGPLGTARLRSAEHAHGGMNHALQGMSGLVMGVTIREPRATAAREAETVAPRAIRLLVRPRATDSATVPRFEYVLSGVRVAAPVDTPALAAPALVLTRGEAVRIVVVNALAEPTAVHWHGIELESYYDGVAGFSGSPRRRSPVIAPGDSFVVRFTPPRAGTFIYHTHVDEERQQPAGLAGPLVVLEPGVAFDPATDVSVIATSPHEGPDSLGMVSRSMLLNGSAAPPPLRWQAGRRYRLRMINVTLRHPGMRFELADGGALVHWRPLAKDGADLPTSRQVPRPARQPVSIGETVDVEIVPERAGELLLTARRADGTTAAVVAVLVSPGSAPR